MAITTVDVANQALARFGARSIAALNEPTPEARACNRLFNSVRDQMLSAHDWRFATGYAPLTPSGVAPAPWLFQSPKPTDCLKVRRVVPVQSANPQSFNDDQSVFDEGIGVIGTTATSLIFTFEDGQFVIYTKKVEDPNLWEESFVSVFTISLAAQIIYPLTGQAQVADRMAQQAAASIQALTPDGQNQGVSAVQRALPSWLEARGSV